MKKRTAALLIGAMVCTALLTGCGEKETEETMTEAAEAADEKEEKDEKKKEKEEAEKEAEEAEETAEAEEPEIELVKVGVLLPEGETGEEDAGILTNALADAGYEALVGLADSGEVQAEQFAELLEGGAEAMIVNPVDAYGLADAVDAADEQGISVFSYDNLIMNTPALDYHTTFDMREAGKETAKTLVKKAELDKAREAKTPLTIEFLMGSLDDSGALFYFNGIMEGLQEYFDDGTLVCKSGRTDFDSNGILRWSETAAKTAMKGILTEFYAEEGAPDIIVTGADAFTYGVQELLDDEKITAGTDGYPIITGLGCEAETVKDIAEGRVAFTLFMDREDLAEKCVQMVSDRLSGEKVSAENYGQYDNGSRIISTETCKAQVIDGDNYEILIDYGVYSKEEIQPEEAAPTPTYNFLEKRESRRAL